MVAVFSSLLSTFERQVLTGAAQIAVDLRQGGGVGTMEGDRTNLFCLQQHLTKGKIIQTYCASTKVILELLDELKAVFRCVKRCSLLFSSSLLNLSAQLWDWD